MVLTVLVVVTVDDRVCQFVIVCAVSDKVTVPVRVSVAGSNDMLRLSIPVSVSGSILVSDRLSSCENDGPEILVDSVGVPGGVIVGVGILTVALLELLSVPSSVRVRDGLTFVSVRVVIFEMDLDFDRSFVSVRDFVGRKTRVKVNVSDGFVFDMDTSCV